MEAEEIVFKKDAVVITKSLARFGGISYPINGIGSVLIKRPSLFHYLMQSIFAGGLIWVGTTLTGWQSATCIGFGILLLLGLLALPTRLVLRTASGDQMAYEHNDPKQVMAVKEAIEKAVTLRG